MSKKCTTLTKQKDLPWKTILIGAGTWAAVRGYARTQAGPLSDPTLKTFFEGVLGEVSIGVAVFAMAMYLIGAKWGQDCKIL